MTEQMDALDRLANDAFPGRVVRKDLVRRVKVGANVPVYVLEFLLGKYCATDDPAAIETGLDVVNQTLTDNFIRPDESEKAKAALKRKGQHRLIDKVEVRLVASEDKFWAQLSNFGDKYVHIPEQLIYTYERLLQGGVWCQLELVYNADDDEAQKRPFYIAGLRPIQVAALDMDAYKEGRARFNRDEWLDLLMRSIGLEHTEMYGGYILGTELAEALGSSIPLAAPDPPSFGVGKRTTAYDLSRLARAIWLASAGKGPLRASRSGVSPREARYLLYLLAHVRDTPKLDRDVGRVPGVAVLHKAGWLDAARHDSGLVVWRGGVLVVTVMTHGGTREADALAGKVAAAGLRRFRG